VTEAIRKYNNLTQRIITGILGSAAIITGICLSRWAYFGLFLFLAIVTLNEFYKLLKSQQIFSERLFGIVSGAACFIISFFIESGDLHQKFFLTIFPLLAIVFIIKLYKKSETKPFTNVAFTLLGLVYIAVPLSLINFIAFTNGKYRYEMILGTLLILWATDTGAYFAGTYLGKHKLFPRVSPKKTWEGFAGGAVLALIFAFGLSRYFDILSLADWLVVGVIIIIGGTFGDLVESLLKRSIEIKDSGNVLPGHGGFLDRFDGLLIASPFLVTYIELFTK
jgi:phosphatidate cytidylyltransferase